MAEYVPFQHFQGVPCDGCGIPWNYMHPTEPRMMRDIPATAENAAQRRNVDAKNEGHYHRMVLTCRNCGCFHYTLEFAASTPKALIGNNAFKGLDLQIFVGTHTPRPEFKKTSWNALIAQQAGKELGEDPEPLPINPGATQEEQIAKELDAITTALEPDPFDPPTAKPTIGLFGKLIWR